MKKPIFDEEFVNGFSKEMKSLEGQLDEVYIKLNKVINAENYLGGNLCSSHVKRLFELNSEFEGFLKNVLSSYNAFLEDMGLSVSELNQNILNENSNIKLFLDVYLSRCSTVSQNDSKWKDLGYIYKGHVVSGNGCGPSSLTNQLISAFGVVDSNIAASLYKEVIALTEKDGLNWMTEYFMNPNSEKYRKYTSLNQLVKSYHGQIIPVTGGKKAVGDFIENYNFDLNKPVVVIGKYSFSQNPNPNTDAWDNGNVIDLVNALYDKGVDASLYFSGVAVGTEDLKFPFRGGAGGHYVSVSINTYEFSEQGTIYLIDSYPKNLEGEDKFKLDYAFNEKPKLFKNFNETYDVSRISDNVLKIKLKNGVDFNKKNMGLLGFVGGSTLALTYDGDKLQETKSIDYQELDKKLSSFVPSDLNEDISVNETAASMDVLDNDEENTSNSVLEYREEVLLDETLSTVDSLEKNDMAEIKSDGVVSENEASNDVSVSEQVNRTDNNHHGYSSNANAKPSNKQLTDNELKYLFEYIFKNSNNQVFNADTKVNLGNSTFLWKDIVNVYLDSNNISDYVEEININQGYISVKLTGGEVIDLGNDVSFNNLALLLKSLKK